HLSLALPGVLVSAVLAIPATAKIGAAENYYFPLAFFLTYAGVAAASVLDRQGKLPRPTMPIVTLGFALNATACFAVVRGLTGVLSVRNHHQRYAAWHACLNGRSPPLFTPDPYGNLPWMTAGPGPHFVLANIYHEDRALGRAFERGGVGGLI